MVDVLYIRACEIRGLIPRGDPANLADMTGNHTYAHETRAHADSRQTCKAICPGSLSGSPSERYAFGMIYLIFTLQQKPIWSHAREGVSTSGICWDERDAFLQPMRFERRYFRARELLRYAARRPNGRDASRLRAPWLHFAGYLPNKFGEFDTTKNPGRKGPGLLITWKTFAKNSGSQTLIRRTQGRQKPASKTKQ